MSGSVLLEVQELRRSFGNVKAVDGVSFTLRGGEIHGFIGPNGAGKTTSMRIMATLDMPDDGDVLLDGRSVLNYPDEARPRIGFMPDYLDSYRDMFVDEYLDFYARAYRLPPGRRRARLADVIEFTGLNGLLDRPVAGMSKGQKQRLSLARVLINDPDILILDEPSAGLDPRARIELRRLIQALADKGKAVLVSSHILTELSEVCDAVTIIEHGRICASDRIQNLQRKVDAGIRVAARLHEPTAEECLRLQRLLLEIPGVLRCEPDPAGAVFTYEGEHHHRAEILRKLIAAEFSVIDFHSMSSDLEEAFMSLTQGEVTL